MQKLPLLSCILLRNEGKTAQITTNPDPRLAGFNKVVIEYQVQVFGNAAALCQFEAILMGDGSVLLQYLDMPQVSGALSARF